MKLLTKFLILCLCVTAVIYNSRGENLQFTKINTDPLFTDLNLFYSISINNNYEITADGYITDSEGNYYLAFGNTTDLGKTWRAFNMRIDANKFGFHPYYYFYDIKQNKHYVYIQNDYLYEIDFENKELIPDLKLGIQDFVFQFYMDGSMYGYHQGESSELHHTYKRINLSNDEITDITPPFGDLQLSVYVIIFSPWGDDGLALFYDLSDGKRNGKFLVSDNKGDSWNQMSVSDNIYDPLTMLGYYYNGIIPKSDNQGLVYFTFNTKENKSSRNLVRIYNNFQTIDTLRGNDTTLFQSFTDFDHAHAIKWYSNKKLGITADMGNTFRIFDITENNITPLNYNVVTNTLISSYINKGDSIFYSQLPVSAVSDNTLKTGETPKTIVGDYLQLPEKALNGEIYIYNSLGSLVYSSGITSTQLYLGSLPHGMYSVILKHDGRYNMQVIYKQ